jgi:integrase
VKRAGLETTFAAPKTDRSRRSVTLPASTVAALRTHRAKQAEEKLAATEYTDLDLIFATQTGGPLSLPNLTRRHFKPLLEAAGLPPMRLYDLRHTAATLLLAAGEHPKIVSERLGHATVTLTLDTYSHVLPDMQAASAEKLEGLLFGTDA